MKKKLFNCISTLYHSISDCLSIGETKVIPWVLNKFSGKDLLEIGAKITYYYFVIFLLFFGWKIPTLLLKSLNEIGDFLAGVFGPIAFGWLVIGYLMQNRELKSNNENTEKSMKLTSQQLKFIEHSKKKEEQEKFISMQPIFSLEEEVKPEKYGDKNYCEILITITKNEAFDLFLIKKNDSTSESKSNTRSHIKQGETESFSLFIEYEPIKNFIEKPDENDFFDSTQVVEVEIHYKDSLGNSVVSDFTLSARNDFDTIKVVCHQENFKWRSNEY